MTRAPLRLLDIKQRGYLSHGKCGVIFSTVFALNSSRNATFPHWYDTKVRALGSETYSSISVSMSPGSANHLENAMGINGTVFASRAERANFNKLQSCWSHQYNIWHNLPFLNIFNRENLNNPDIGDLHSLAISDIS
jgi:hypothetical protein